MTTLSAFTKDAIQNEESGTILDRILELREARKTLEIEKDKLATEVADLFTERVSEKLASPAESQAKEMIDRLIEDIESEIDDDGDIDSSGTEISPELGDDRERADDGDSYRIQFVDGGSVLAEFEDTQQANVFVEAVNYLVQNYDLVSKLEPLPYVPGRTRPIIHDRTNVDGKNMKQPRELIDGSYIETNLSSVQKRRELDRLVESFDFAVESNSDW